MTKKFNPNERHYKVRNASGHFICPLCGSERSFRYSSRLSTWNYIQIVACSVVVIALLYPLIQEKALIAFFFIWGAFELVMKMNFRKEIPCPHCGFDATWYKRDVKVARKLVNDFWSGDETTATPTAAPVAESVPVPEKKHHSDSPYFS